MVKTMSEIKKDYGTEGRKQAIIIVAAVVGYFAILTLISRRK